MPRIELDRPLELMRDARTIAVVGVKDDPEKASNYVTAYLIGVGYTIYLVNPDETEVFGMPVYDRLQDLPERVDIVDIFRRPAQVPPVIEDAIAAGARAVWMQLGIVNEDAAARAREAGLEVVMDRCTKVEHGRLDSLGLAPSPRNSAPRT
jgi:predicted CoA-binding protein